MGKLDQQPRTHAEMRAAAHCAMPGRLASEQHLVSFGAPPLQATREAS